MTGIIKRLHDLLDEQGVEYEILHHRDDFRAQTTAADTHTPPREFAKTVFLWIDGGYAIAVLPATHFVAESKLARSLDAEKVRLASEFEMQVEIAEDGSGVSYSWTMTTDGKVVSSHTAEFEL